jgi:hypothetical protein
MSDDGLLRIVPAAADHGHSSARRFLERLSRNPELLSSAQLDTLFSTRTAHIPRSDDVFDIILSIATGTGRTLALNKMVNSAERRRKSLNRHGPALLKHARELLAGGDESKRRGGQFLAELMAKIDTGMAWPELRVVLDDVEDPRVLVRLIQQLWQQTPTGDISAQLDYLSQFITIQPNAEKPVTRTSVDVEMSVAVASAWAMLYILGSRTDADAENWSLIRTLGLYEVEQDEIFVEDRRLLIVSDYLVRLGETDPHRIGENLIDYLMALASGEFRGVVGPVAWRRELRNAVHHACARGDQRIIESLVGVCGTLNDSIVEVITSAIAERHYVDAREHIRKLSRARISPDLRSFILDLVRTHDRSFGTRAFPEILRR